MKEIKLYNMLFPIWFLLFFPPVILITLIGNFIIDSLVLVACYYVFKVVDAKINLKTFYKSNIIKVWVFGFLADIIGAGLLLVIAFFGEDYGMSYDLIMAISYDPFSMMWAVAIILLSMTVSAVLIFIFNYKITFKRLIVEKQLRFKIALTIAIITMPWTFLLPTKWIY